MTSSGRHEFDVAVVGAGIVGLATALRLLERVPELRIAVLEKEAAVATHQTGHNSGVVHAGLYYAPGSLKARLCRVGKRQLEAYAESHGIPVVQRGKLVIAVDESERSRLLALYERAVTNAVPGVQLLGASELREREPDIVGVAAIWSPTTAVVDYPMVARAVAADLVERGSTIQAGREVSGLRESRSSVVIRTTTGDLVARHVIACAGLQADRLARMSGHAVAGVIVPFRGDYYTLSRSAADHVRGLVYPVPDPRFPFLGVHFTRSVDGTVHAGPNAVLAFARHGYRRSDVNLRDLAATLTDRGFLRLAFRYWRTGAVEMVRDWSKRAFLASLRRYLPVLDMDDLEPAPSGVRAQLVRRNGTLADDFVIVGSGRLLHVLNAPSPAATASFAIGDELASRAIRQFGFRERS